MPGTTKPSLPRLSFIIALVSAIPLTGMQCPVPGPGSDGFSEEQELLVPTGNQAVETNPDAEDLSIVQATPDGKIGAGDMRKEIVVVFDRPVVPLARLEAETRGVFQLDPPTSGRFRWYGSRVCAFQPESGYRPGTDYTVRIPAGIEALDGSQLKAEHTFEFQTPPLRVLSARPSAQEIAYAPTFTLFFNYPVEETDARQHIKLVADGATIPIRVSYDSQIEQAEENAPLIAEEENTELNRKRRIVVEPLQELPRDAEVQLTVDESLRPIGGNRGMEDGYEKRYQTYGPLTVSANEGSRFYQSLYRHFFQFNNPVKLREAAEAIRFEPEAALRGRPDGTGTRIYMGAYALKPDQEYTVTVSPDLTDAYGNGITGQRVFQVTIPRVRRDFSTDEGFYTIERRERQRLPVMVAGVEELETEVRTLTLADIQSYVKNNGNSLRHFESILTGSLAWDTGTAANEILTRPFDLADHLENKRGWRWVRFSGTVENWRGESQTQRTYQVVQSTDIGMVVKQSANYSHVWLHSLTPGKPLDGLPVNAYDGERNLGDCTTNRVGYCRIRHVGRPLHPLYVAGPKDPDGSDDEKDATFVTARHDGLYMGSLAGDFDLHSHGPRVLGQIVFDRRLYRPGDTMHFKAALAVRENGRLRDSNIGTVRAVIRDSRGKQIYARNLRASGSGGVWGQLEVPADAPTGHFSVSLDVPELKEKFDELDRSTLQRSYRYNSVQYYGRFRVADTFQVEEFRPVNFSVSIEGKDRIQLGDAEPYTIEGKYLFGAPMMNAGVTYSIHRTRQARSFDNFPGYAFGDRDYVDAEYGEAQHANGEGQLNGAGRLEITVPATGLTIAASDMGLEGDRRFAPLQKLNIEARVSDVDDKSVAHNKSVDVMPGNHLIGISPVYAFQSKDKPFEFKLVAVNGDGQAAGNLPATVHIVRNEWKTIQTEGPGDSLQRKNTLVRTRVHTARVNLNASPTTFRYKADEAGWYSLIVHGNDSATYARVSFYVLGPGFVGWNFADDDRVELLLDRDSYKPGDTARLMIQSPFESAEAIVTLERDDVIYQRSFHIEGNGEPIEIPITAEHAPTVYASVMLIRGRVPNEIENPQTEAEADLGRPQFKVGYVRLNVSTEQYRLPLKVETDRAAYSPRDTVQLRIQTAPGAEVALAVADRAVLDLIQYDYADPLPIFYGRTPLGVFVAENRRSLIRQLTYTRKGTSPGGKAEDSRITGTGGFDEDSEDGTRRDFRHTAHWAPALRADENGIIELKFVLPDNLTTFRIMALAAHNGRFESLSREFQVKQPIVVQPLMPRFIRPGDQLQAGAVIINQSGNDARIELGMTSQLLRFAGNTHEATNTIEIPSGESRELTFPVELNGSAYIAKKQTMLEELARDDSTYERGIAVASVDGILNARVLNPPTRNAIFSAEQLRDRVRFEFPVREHPAVEAFAIAGYSDEGSEVAEGIVIPKEDEILDNIGRLELALSSTALTGLDRAFYFFRSNPYFCLEQRASAYMVSLTAEPLMQSFVDVPATTTDYNFANNRAFFLGVLPEFQNSDGGFFLWKESSYRVSNPYLTAYVIFVLQVAKERGESIDQGVYDRAMAYLRNYIRNPARANRRYSIETLAMMAYVTARDGQAVPTLNNYLVSKQDMLSLRGKGYLVQALFAEREPDDWKNDEQIAELVQKIRNRMQFNTQRISFEEENRAAYSRSFYARGATIGVLLSMFMQLEPENPLIPQVVRHLITDGVYWRDSHSAGNLAYALLKYHERYESEVNSGATASVRIGDRTVMRQEFPGNTLERYRSTRILRELAEIAAPGEEHPLLFRGEGIQRLYYTATLRYLPNLVRTDARDEGIEIRRQVLGLERGPNGSLPLISDDAKLERGEVYLVRLIVTNPKPAYHLAITDPLPASMEAVNTRFATEGQELGSFVQVARSTGNWWDAMDNVYEYRDDRVVITREYLWAGVHEYFYLLRPLVRGKASRPAAQAFMMYEPEVFGRTAAGVREVR